MFGPIKRAGLLVGLPIAGGLLCSLQVIAVVTFIPCASIEYIATGDILTTQTCGKIAGEFIGKSIIEPLVQLEDPDYRWNHRLW